MNLCAVAQDQDFVDRFRRSNPRMDGYGMYIQRDQLAQGEPTRADAVSKSQGRAPASLHPGFLALYIRRTGVIAVKLAEWAGRLIW